MNITKDEIDPIKLPSIGWFVKVASPNNDNKGEPLFRYIPDLVRKGASIARLQSEIQKLLTEAIETLPRDEQLALSLYYCDQLSIEEIEAVLGIDQDSIRRLYKNAMRTLRSKIRE
jgi:RNA polymerase sigma factor (sigma-70 family)